MAKLVEWRNFEHNNEKKLLFITKIGMRSFLLATQWPHRAWSKSKEFVNAADVDDGIAMIARVHGPHVKIYIELIVSILKLPIVSIIEPLIVVDQPPNTRPYNTPRLCSIYQQIS